MYTPHIYNKTPFFFWSLTLYSVGFTIFALFNQFFGFDVWLGTEEIYLVLILSISIVGCFRDKKRIPSILFSLFIVFFFYPSYIHFFDALKSPHWDSGVVYAFTSIYNLFDLIAYAPMALFVLYPLTNAVWKGLFNNSRVTNDQGSRKRSSLSSKIYLVFVSIVFLLQLAPSWIFTILYLNMTILGTILIGPIVSYGLLVALFVFSIRYTKHVNASDRKKRYTSRVLLLVNIGLFIFLIYHHFSVGFLPYAIFD